MIISELQLFNFRKFNCVDNTPGLVVTFHKGLGDISLGNKIKKQKKLVIMRVCGWMAPSG